MEIEVTSRSLFKGRPDKSALLKEIQPNPSVARRKSISRFQSARAVTRLMRRNFSSRAPELSGGQAIILSIPKSGRTWVRTFLCAYFCKRYGREFTLEPERYGEPGIPRLIFSHDCFEHRTKGDLWDRIRGKYLVPKKELRRAKIVLLVRDPRDCFVSLYVQMTRRDRGAPDEFKRKTVSDLLRGKKFGVRAIIKKKKHSYEHRVRIELCERSSDLCSSDLIRGKYLVPKKELRRAKIVLLVRDPRDCFVSLYVQMTRRDRGAPDEFKRKTVSDLLRGKKFGVRAIIKTMN